MTAPHFSAVAWDIDGTLVDSEPLHHQALVAASAGFGADLSDLPDMAFRGIHMGDVWRLLAGRLPADLEEAVWLEAINRHYVANRHQLSAVPGAVETIERLAALGIPQVCVSNSGRSVVDANLDFLGILPHIRFSLSLDDVPEGKPSPVPYRMAADALGLPPAAVVAVEDSQTGLISARAAGLHAVLLEEAASEPGEGPSVAHLTDLLPLFG